MDKQTNIDAGILSTVLKLLAAELIGQLLPHIKAAVREELIASQQEAQQDKVFTKVELAKMLKVSTVTIDAWDRDGRLKSHRIGRRVYFKNSDVQDSLQHLKKYKNSL